MSYTVAPGASPLSLSERDTVRSVLQNIGVILATPKGSVPQYREFGLDMSFVDMPIPIARSMLVAAATEAIHKFEPRAEVREITFESDDTFPGKLIPIAEVDIVDD